MYRSRLAVAGIGAATLVGLAAAPASAHVSPDRTEVAAGSFSSVTLSVGHGCDGASTTAIAIQIPASILDVTPQVHPGWDVVVETAPLSEPVDLGQGETATERESVVTYTAEPGNELLDGFRDTFTLGYQAPDTPGEYLFFKTIQTCLGGLENAWIEEYTGEGEEPEHPAPAVLVTESTGEGHGEEAEEAETTETTAATGTEVAAETVSSTDDDSSDGLAVAALVVGALGLVFGGAALLKLRRS